MAHKSEITTYRYIALCIVKKPIYSVHVYKINAQPASKGKWSTCPSVPIFNVLWFVKNVHSFSSWYHTIENHLSTTNALQCSWSLSITISDFKTPKKWKNALILLSHVIFCWVWHWPIPWRFSHTMSAQLLKNWLSGLHKIQWSTCPNGQAAPVSPIG